MDFDNMFDSREFLLEFLDIKIVRCSFHEHAHAVLHDSERCEHDEDREEIRANRIGQMPVVELLGITQQVDEKCCNHNTNGLNHISNHVDHRSSQVIVLLFPDIRKILLLFNVISSIVVVVVLTRSSNRIMRMRMLLMYLFLMLMRVMCLLGFFFV